VVHFCSGPPVHFLSALDNLQKLVRKGAAGDRLADIQEHICLTERRITEVMEELTALGRELVDEQEATRALAQFEPVWDALSPRKQVRLMQLLVERVDYDGEKGTMSVTFHPTGIRSLQEAAA
jgi:site-specific DNA recombinase